MGRARRAGELQQYRKYQGQQTNNSPKEQIQEKYSIKYKEIDFKTNDEEEIGNKGAEVGVDDEQVGSVAGDSVQLAGVDIGMEIEMRDTQIYSSTDHSMAEIIKSAVSTATNLTALVKPPEAEMDTVAICVDSRVIELNSWTHCNKTKLFASNANNNDSRTANYNNNADQTNNVSCNNTKNVTNFNPNNINESVIGNKQFSENKEFWNVARHFYAQCSENNEILRLQQQQSSLQPLQQYQQHLRPQPIQRQHHQQQQPHHQTHSEQLQRPATHIF